MRSQGGVTPLRLLLILAVLCGTGFSLTCYNCQNFTTYCSSTSVCTPNLDTCLIVVAGKRHYHHCWRYADCNLQFLMERLDENKLVYKCCQKDLCNERLGKDGATAALSGKTVLLVAPFLVAVWNLRF
ncbi:CD59 glycoprotein [Erethizon dorsatum]